MPDKRLFIQQPYFLPWLGFFAKLAASDVFVCLDRAPFRRNHLARVAILNSAGRRQWLTVPLGASQGALLSNLLVPPNPSYVDRFLRTLYHSYRRATFFSDEWPFVEACLMDYGEQAGQLVPKANLRLIAAVSEYLAIAHPCTVLESSLELPEDRNRKMVGAVRATRSTVLVCGDGGSTVVHDLDLLRLEECRIELLPYFRRHPEYRQIHQCFGREEFAQGLSFVDALLNVGRRRTQALINAVETEPLHVD